MKIPSSAIADRFRAQLPAGVRRSAERGISLLIVLIALLLMSLAAVGLIRMVDTGNLIVGNLAFKQSTTAAADRASEEAITWLFANVTGATLNTTNAGFGYYATSLVGLDVTGKSTLSTRVLADWNDDNCAYATSGTFASCIAPSAENSAGGYTTRYVITRLCKTAGDPNDTSNSCVKPVSGGAGASLVRNATDYPSGRFGTTTSSPYFRIVARSEGPQSTLSYTETYVHF
ncbi:MAG: hypothetical protein A3I66_05880 [Burkholderiales bacterium RIFCSPLOWO2_02_FULL_57_36]|nr:MAG: hypothetical protein A3I66_05880 [Burkholderiales bacterium RIFCSPLOWO2_02_FULL_57_36]